MGDAVVAETNNDRADDVEWDPKNKSVPIGWKIGKNKSTQQRVIQSSEGFFFDSRVKALQFMLNSSYHESLVNLMRYYLGEEGWIQDKSCPKKWKTRRLQGGSVDWEFLSPTMEVVSGMEDMLGIMRSQNFDKKEIQRIEDKITANNVHIGSRGDNLSSPTKIIPTSVGKITLTSIDKLQDKPDKKDTELDENIKKEKISVESNRGNITLTTIEKLKARSDRNYSELKTK